MAHSKKKTLSPTVAICKEPECFETATTKGYCRLHFLKVLAGKSEGDASPRGRLKMVRERRRSDRFKGPDEETSGEYSEVEIQSRLENLEEDVGLEDLDLDPTPTPFTGSRKKAS